MRVLAQKQSFSTGKLVIILLENQQQPREAPIGNEVRTKKAKNKKKRNYFFNWIYMLEALRLCRAPCLPCLCSCQFCNNSSKNQISSTNLTRPTSVVPPPCMCVCVREMAVTFAGRLSFCPRAPASVYAPSHWLPTFLLNFRRCLSFGLWNFHIFCITLLLLCCPYCPPPFAPGGSLC